MPWKFILFLAFIFIFFQNMEMKRKNTEKSFFLKKYIFFIKMACITFYVTNIYFFKKKVFSVFFLFISMFWMKMKEKARNILTFHGNSFFFSQNCINYPVSSVSWRINILSKKDHLFFSSEKRNICNFTKKVSFQRKSYFFDNFLLISLF